MRVLVSILLFGMLSMVAADDEVKLKNGDRLSGKVVGLSGGKLSMVTPETGPVTLDWTQIASMQAGYGPKFHASAVLPDGHLAAFDCFFKTRLQGLS